MESRIYNKVKEITFMYAFCQLYKFTVIQGGFWASLRNLSVGQWKNYCLISYKNKGSKDHEYKKAFVHLSAS